MHFGTGSGSYGTKVEAKEAQHYEAHDLGGLANAAEHSNSHNYGGL